MLRQIPPSGELDFIKRTATSFNNLHLSSGNQSLKTRSAFIHNKPRIRYYINGPLFPDTNIPIELSDLLFVYKHYLNGILNSYRAILVQTKYTNERRKSWVIDRDQFYFLIYWPPFEIISTKFKKFYNIRPNKLTYSTYGFIGSKVCRHPRYYTSKRILREIGTMPSTKKFIFHMKSNVGWDSSTSFLQRIIQGTVGEDLLANKEAKSLVDNLYIIVGWKPDPPEEPIWIVEDNDEEKGFCIVEITVSVEGNQIE